MKVLIHLAHPAHFHLFKNVIRELINNNKIVVITYNEKDVLEQLINNSEYKSISRKLRSRKNIDNKFDLLFQFLEKIISLFKIIKSERPNIVVGTSIIISLASKPFGIRNIIVNEDDFDIIEKTANLGYRFATNIVCPEVCRTGKWDYKCIKLNSYHELSYLHPNNFTPNKEIVKKYINDADHPYFILRFAKLAAHHDDGIKGIGDNLALEIISKLEEHGKVYITTERDIGKQLNNYRLTVNPLDMHHILAYTKLYIGDSQTMAAEAGVLGTPFIRINDFVGKISYLDELENHYELGWGIKPNDPDKIMKVIDTILLQDDFYDEIQKKRVRMLNEKVDYSVFLSKLIEDNFNHEK